MENRPDTEAQKEEQRLQTAVRANSAMQSVGANPEDATKYYKLAKTLSKETGAPLLSIPVTRANEQTFQKFVDDLQTTASLVGSPRLAEYLAENPTTAVLAKDDIKPLSWWDTTPPPNAHLKYPSTGGRTAVTSRDLMNDQHSLRESFSARNSGDQFHVATTSQVVRTEHPTGLVRAGKNAIEFLKAIPGGATSEIGHITEGAGHVVRPSDPALWMSMRERIANVDKILPHQRDLLLRDIRSQNVLDKRLAEDTVKDVLYGRITSEEALKRFDSDYTSGLNELSKLLVGTGASIQDYGETILPAEPGFENDWGRNAGRTFGSMIPAAVVSAGSSGTGAVMSFLGTGGNLASEARKAGQSEEIQSRVMLLGGATSFIGLTPVDKMLPKGFSNSFFKKAVIDGLKEGTQTVAQNQVVIRTYDSDKKWDDGLYESIIVGGISSGISSTVDKAKTDFQRNTLNAQKATQVQVIIDDMSVHTRGSKLQQRAPEEFESYVSKAVERKPIENTYVDANTLFDQVAADGSDPYLFAEVAGITKQQLDAARESGGDLKIPTAIYATRIATTADALMKNHIRFDPDAMSYTQALEHNKNSDSKRRDVEAETVKSSERAKADTLAAAKIYHESMQRGISNGQSEAVARGDALMQTTIYGATAKRNGTNPETLIPRDSGTPLPNRRNSDSVSDATPKANNEAATGVDLETRLKANAEFGKSAVQSLLHVTKNKPIDKNRKKNVGRAGDRVAQAVRDATGLDISNTQHSLNTRTIRDSINTKHADPQRQVVDADVEAIPDIISSADRIISGAKNARGKPIIGYIKHMSDGRTLYLEQTKTGAKTVTFNALNKYPAGTDFDTVSQTVLSDARAKGGDNVKMTPVQKGDAQPLPQAKTESKRASALESQSFGGAGTAVIMALAGAGLTEVADQGASYFLAQQQDMAERGEPNAIVAMAQLNDWWGQNGKKVADAGAHATGNTDPTASGGTTILGTVSTDNKPATTVVDSGMQRQFSRDFQTYMLEGKVPSPELPGTFETARKWLTTAYQTVIALNGKTSPEVAELFSRMLASDGQLEMARLDAGESGPIFASADAMGLSDAAYADFTATRQQSEDEASAEMLQSVMQPVRREQDKAYAQEKATVRAQVEQQVNTEGHYRATELMSNRRWLGDGEMPDHLADIRFDEAMLVSHYGEGVLDLLPRGRQTVYTAKGGLDPDDVASIFGYSSGDELLRLMVTQPTRTESIDIETARIMRERHGDPLYDGTADLKAMDAIHNDRRGQWLAMELKAVGRLSNTAQNTSLKEAHESALSMISTMSVADAMESRRFLAAERRAAEEAEHLGAKLSTVSTDDEGATVTTQNGDTAVDADIATGTPADNNETAKKLYTAKKRQLLNHALYVESRKIAHEVEEMERYVQSVDTPARREHFATASFHDNGRIDYNSAMDDLLGRYELSATQTNDQFGTLAGRQVGATGGLDAFMEQVKAAGRENELAISDAVLSTTTRTPYQKLPLQMLRSVVNSIRNLEHITNRAGKLVDADQTRDFEQTVSGVLAAFARAPSGVQGQSIANDMAPAAADSGVTGGTGSNGRPRPYLDPAMNANLVLRDLDGSKKAGAVQAAIKAPVDAAAEQLLARKQKAASDLAALYDVYSPTERQDMGRRLHVPALGRSISKWDMIAIALNTGNAENRRQLTDETINGALSEQQVVTVLRHLDVRDADFVQSVWDYVGSFRTDIAAREKRVTGVTPEWVDATPVMIGGKKLAGGYYPLHTNTDDVPQALVAGQFAKAQTSGLHGRQQEGQTATPLALDMSVLHSHVNALVHDLELSEVVANTGRLLRDERIQAAFIQTGKGADHVMLQGWLRDAATGDTSGAALLSGTARFAKDNVTAARLASELGFSITQMSGLSAAISSIGQERFAVNLQTVLRPGMIQRVAALSPYMSSRQSTFENAGDGKNTPLGGLSSWMSQRLNHQMVEVPVWLAGYHQGLDKYRQDEAKAISHADRQVKSLQSSRDGKSSGMNSTQTREAETLLTALGSLMTAKSGTDKNGVQQGAMPVGNNAGEGIALAVDIAALFHADAVLKAVANGRSPASDTSSNDRQTVLSIAETLPFFRDAESRNAGSSNGTRKLAAIINASGGLNGIDASGLMAAHKTTGLSFGLPATQISQVVEARVPQLSGGETSLLPLLASRSA